MTQAFHNFFTAKGPDVAREVTKKQMSNQSLAFVLVTKLSFFFCCLKAPDVTAIYMLTGEINERKACRLDKILCKLLKLASGIVGPSLLSIFKSLAETGLCQAKLEGG